MKQYRCPYCGEESITLAERCISVEWKKSLYGLKRGNSCPSCGNHFGNHYIHKWSYNLFLLFTFSLVLLFFGLAFLYKAVFGLVLVIYIFFLIFFLLPLGTFAFCSLTQYDQEKLMPFTLPPNAKIEIIRLKRPIRNLSILGVQFYKKTDVVRFHEAFTNDLVPVVFYENNKKQKSPINVTFMKSEFIPNTLFTEGSEFIVIDNGKEIAQGKILEIYDKGSNIH